MDIEEKQLKNLKRKIVDFLWKTTPQNIVKIAVILNIKIPKQLYKFLSKQEDKSSEQ